MKSRSSRLKNFCEICRKQCKDENGFTCHLNSVSHQRRVRQYVDNPSQHLQKYSKQLQYKIIQTLKVKYPGEPKRILDLWQEYQQEKYHIEFRQTNWRNLQEFIQHLKGIKNLAVTGDFPNTKVTYLVSKTSEFVKEHKQKQIENLRHREKEHEQQSLKSRMERLRQVQQSKFQKLQEEMRRMHEEIQERDDQRQGGRLLIRIDGFGQGPKRDPFYDANQLENEANDQIQKTRQPKKVLKNADFLLQKFRKQEGNRQEQKQREEQDQQWIMQGILVRIKPHNISEVFHGKKTRVLEVTEPYVAKVQLGNATLEIDQAYLETVIPKVNHKVRLLLGDKRGKEGVLQQVYIEEGFGVINIEDRLFQVPFNAFSKVE